MSQHPVNDQTLPQSPFTQHQLISREHLHGGLKNQRTRNDDFGTAIINRRLDATLLRRHRYQLLNQAIKPLPCDSIAMQSQRRAIVFASQQSTDGHGGSTGGNHHRALPRLDATADLINSWL